MSAVSPPSLRVLHAVRTLGHGSIERIRDRGGESLSQTEEHLRDAEAWGWVTWSSFAEQSGGWSMTERGRQEGERLLAEELVTADARPQIEAVYREFLPLNDEVASACTQWQLAELDLGDPVSLIETLAHLQHAASRLRTLQESLVHVLSRFAGYHQRFRKAVDQAADDPRWITAMDRDSCHRVWFELHEDLIATLGLTR